MNTKTETNEKVLILRNELDFAEQALYKASKVYCLWFHRKFLISQIFNIIEHEPNKDDEIFCDLKSKLLSSEFDLCEKVFGIDARNFHCWSHYRYLISLDCVEYDEKVNKMKILSEKLIDQDFSNYSAWHLRWLDFLSHIFNSLTSVHSCLGQQIPRRSNQGFSTSYQNYKTRILQSQTMKVFGIITSEVIFFLTILCSGGYFLIKRSQLRTRVLIWSPVTVNCSKMFSFNFIQTTHRQPWK